MAIMTLRFKDRRQAGGVLAQRLMAYAGRPDVVILALPPGGVPVALEVARLLRVPLDVLLVRKLGVPGYEERAMGAIAAGGTRWIDWEVVEACRVGRDDIERVVREEEQELLQEERIYRGDRPWPTLLGRTVIIIDDGLTTGSTMRAAVAALREQHPARIVVGVPIGAPNTCAELRAIADEAVCALTPEPFVAVGFWYRDFSEAPESDVRSLLEADPRAFRTSAAQPLA